jgi:catechol 2,3-dioxygenase-like lactoylglutathione lyase family enzyme
MGTQSGKSIEFAPIEVGTRIGHVHPKVADLQRALDFYCGILGFELTQRHGAQAAFVLGTAQGDPRHRPGPPDSITSPFSIRRARRLPMPCGACSLPTYR